MSFTKPCLRIKEPSSHPPIKLYVKGQQPPDPDSMHLYTQLWGQHSKDLGSNSVQFHNMYSAAKSNTSSAIWANEEAPVLFIVSAGLSADTMSDLLESVVGNEWSCDEQYKKKLLT